MMELMNCVLDDRKKSETKGRRHIKKREKKSFTKTGATDERPLVQQIFKPSDSSDKGETPVVAVDCEMVETDRWGEGLARCSIVNANGHILMDKFVIPEGSVTNYRTWVSGVTPHHLKPESGAIPY